MFNWLRKLLGKKNKPTAPITPRNPSTNTKYGLCVGINKFKDSRVNLRGCENDANAALHLLTKQDFQVKKLLSSQATKDNIIKAIKEIQGKAVSGDEFFFTLSSHGSNTKDLNGDELDELDETWVTHDLRHITDDELRILIDGFADNVKITIFSDSCHSGTMTRNLLSALTSDEYLVPKFLPSADDEEVIANARLVPKELDPEDMREVLISGCMAHEYSFDAKINGQYRGALSCFAFKILEDDSTITYRELHNRILKYLPKGVLAQTPQLEGSIANLNKKVFE